jgi:hypothetical protein
MVLNSEVLPAPLGPMTAVIDLGATAKLTPLMALTPPNASVTSSTCRIGDSRLSFNGLLRETTVLVMRSALLLLLNFSAA